MNKIIKQESELIQAKNQCECNFELLEVRNLELKQSKSENRDLQAKFEQIKSENIENKTQHKLLIANVRSAHREEIKQIKIQSNDEISQLKFELNSQKEQVKSETSKMEPQMRQEIVYKNTKPNPEPMSQPSEPKRKRIQAPENSFSKLNFATISSSTSKELAQFVRGGGRQNVEGTKLRSGIQNIFEFQPNSIGIPLRTESRQLEAHRRLTCKLSFKYKNYMKEIADLQNNLETDILNSSLIVLRKRNLNSSSGLIPCGHYQQENCKYDEPEHYFRSELRHHFCVFCMNLRSQTRRHEAANCEMFKMLDSWFKDYAGA